MMPAQVEGTVAQNGICLGDITGDGNHELIVGNEAGELFIFKVFKSFCSYSWFDLRLLSPTFLQIFRLEGYKGDAMVTLH